MKYLKLFENYGEDLYSSTDQETFDSIGFDSECKNIKFSVDLKQQIVDKLNSDWLIVDPSKDLKHMSGPKLSDSCELVFYKNDGSKLFIYYSEDEWYYCEYYNVNSESILHRYLYYKCDQMEGLTQLLEDLEIINFSKAYIQNYTNDVIENKVTYRNKIKK
jgi:hypothetical protein